MNTRTLALAFAAAVCACTVAPAFAQDTMPASASTAMSHDAMQPKDAMKGSMSKDDMTMKKDAMKPAAAKSNAMKHDAAMKKDDAMKMKKDPADAASSGG